MIEKEIPLFDPQHGVVLEESASALTQGWVGPVPEGYQSTRSK